MRKNYERDTDHFTAEAYTVRGERGIAWYVLGWELEPGASEWYDGEIGEWVSDEEPEPVRTGRVIAIMVGDDHHFTFDEEDLSPLAREAYCGECGQIGCAHDGLDREESDNG